MKESLVLVALFGTMGYALAGITLADVRAAEWDSYKLEFNKNYEDESEDRLRMQVFQANKQIIDAHNERWAAGEESYEMGVNHFTDLLEKEFDELITGNDGSRDDEEADEDTSDVELNSEPHPYDVDWRKLGAVTPVQHQGHFNNSWAFAAAGAVESRKFVASGRLVKLSKQNLVDCCRTKHKRTFNALKCIKRKRGIDTEASYPYRGPAGRCRFKKKLVGAKIRRHLQSPLGNELALAHNVAAGPVAAVISRDALRFYKSGVYHNTSCSKAPDYAVLIVGYGHCENYGDYWLLKTSLGATWGEQGYLRLARNRHNICGIASRAYYPVIKCTEIKMKAAFVIVALLGVAACTLGGATYSEQPNREWDDFKFQFDKIYGDESEEQLRMLIFQDNNKIIDAHNERWAAGEESYEMGVNQFTDMLPSEISKGFANNDDEHPIEDLEPEPNDYLNEVGDLDLDMPVKVNWTQLGAVTPVMNQGHFNNSWAFAAAGVVESHQFIKSGRLVALSKQNLVDCCGKHNKLTVNALICIKRMRGIDTEASYPYRGITGKCQFQRKLIGAKVKKIIQVRPGNENELAYNVAKGPIAAVIPQAAIINYKSGVFHNSHCGQSPDFAVLIVGFGTCKNFGDYWIIKTSLGSTWGEKGYMRLARNKQNLCGITNRAYYPALY
ncbi:uncharacterized protein [Drosophila virilis]|nr:cathepsin L [Drosophila virilis]